MEQSWFNTSDTLAAQMNAGASTATLSAGNFGTASGVQYLTVDGLTPSKAAQFRCTIAGTAITAMTLVQGPDVVHAIGAPVSFDLGPNQWSDTTTITIGYTELTTSFTSTVTPTVTDITGLAATVTVPQGGRRMKITVSPSYVKSTAVAGTSVIVYIREGATTLAQTIVDIPVSGYAVPMTVYYSAVPSAGSHTYKVSMSQAAAGTMTFGSAGTTGPSFILVEMI